MSAVARAEQAVTPNACGRCGVPQGNHGTRWHPDAGMHPYQPPTDAQRLARMKARRTQQEET